MEKGDVRRLLCLVPLVLMTACSQNQPKVAELQKINKQETLKLTKLSFIPKKVQKQEETLKLTNLSSKAVVNEVEEHWVPLKVEDEIEWNAKELLGHKYVWGATGPVNYDCSGFTRKIFDDIGVHLPRVSREQAKVGKKIKFSELKKGDLIFFATKRRHPHRVTHVGIYLGNGDFIHASSAAKKIVICNFKKHCFYKKKFLWARRVLKENSHVATTKVAKKVKSLL